MQQKPLFIAIIFIIAFIVFGNAYYSCHSNASNPLATSDEDSIAQESIDSLSNITASLQNTIDKVEKDSISKTMQEEIERLSKYFKEISDEFSDKIWIHSKGEPKYRNQNATYCYFMKQNNKVSNFRFVLQYESGDWLFIKDLIFNIDGKVFEYPGLDFDTDCGNGGRIWEWCDLQLRDKELINALESAKSVRIKMNGSKYYDVRTLNKKTITSIQNTIKYYKVLGGKF